MQCTGAILLKYLSLFSAIKEFLPFIAIFKIGGKKNLRIITKNNAADPELRFLTKSTSKLFDCATVMPTALDLTLRLIQAEKLLINAFLNHKSVFIIIAKSNNRHRHNSLWPRFFGG